MAAFLGLSHLFLVTTCARCWAHGGDCRQGSCLFRRCVLEPDQETAVRVLGGRWGGADDLRAKEFQKQVLLEAGWNLGFNLGASCWVLCVAFLVIAVGEEQSPRLA